MLLSACIAAGYDSHARYSVPFLQVTGSKVYATTRCTVVHTYSYILYTQPVPENNAIVLYLITSVSALGDTKLYSSMRPYSTHNGLK